jgi:ATP-dependent DNA helicase RecG
MNSTEAQLLSLLRRPLEFASADDFRRLPQVKNLTSTLEGVLARCASQLSIETRNALAKEVPRIDSHVESIRKNSILNLLGLLRGESPLAPEIPRSTRPANSAAQPTRLKPKPAHEHQPKGQTPKRLAMSQTSGLLATSLKAAKVRISPKLVATLNKKQLRTIGDVLFLVPRAYEDRRQFLKIAQLMTDGRHTVLVEVRQVVEQTVSGGRRQLRVILGDASGTIAAVFFQTAPWLKARFSVGKKVVVTGEVRRSNFGWEMPHPDVEPADDAVTSPIHFGRVVPVYSGFERHEQRALRQLTFQLCERFVPSIEESLPEDMRQAYGLAPLSAAIASLHFPPGDVKLTALENHEDAAHRRLAFDELFFLQLRLALRRQGIRQREGYCQHIDQGLIDSAFALLPFSLTNAQRTAAESIFADLRRAEPMNRLLQGDVGSGKTAVALLATAATVKNELQVALMAPTELLAQQLYANFVKWLGPWGTQVRLLTGSLTARQKAETMRDTVNNTVDVVVGTHALFEERIEFDRLGLVVIDEQHRFGVMQRKALMTKGKQPDVLVMTATPIPRTLSMTLYGDLDVSVLNELPPGRTPIQTRIFRRSERARMLQLLKEQLEQRRQAYIVYPLVEESEKIDLKDAAQGAQEMQAAFNAHRVGLLHGRLKATEKAQTMARFRAGEIDILVSTTVIEVGVDVPNATVMVIEHAERFGLSQLHQLRGRVGRGAASSFCFLVPAHTGSETAVQRLEVMERTQDGFQVAEADLQIRGPGELLGTRQSGMPELALSSVVRDATLLANVQSLARKMVEEDPLLKRSAHASIARALDSFWGGRLEIADVG